MSDNEKRVLPASLPADAKGFTRRMKMHINFGDDGGAAIFAIHGPDGEHLPISCQYDTRKKGANQSGFFIDGVEQVFKGWAELAEYWPTYVESVKT